MWMWVQSGEDLLGYLPHPAEELGDRLIQLEDGAALSDSFDNFSLRCNLFSSRCGNMCVLSILDGVELAAVPAVGSVLGAVQDRLLPSLVSSDMIFLELGWRLDEARALDH